MTKRKVEPKRKSIMQHQFEPPKKRGRKSKSEIADDRKREITQSQISHFQQQGKNGRKLSKLTAHAKNVIDKSAIDGMSQREVPLNQLRSSVNSYFGAADRLAHGERFKVLARRVTTVGKIQYLVEWEGLIP